MAGAIKKADTKNIANTATACGNKDGKRERRESVVVIRSKLLRERGDWGLAMCASLCDEILLSRVKIEIASSSFFVQ